MYDYCISLIFFVFFIAFLYSLGSVLVSEDACLPYRFVCGYLIYSFIIAIGGIIVQLFNLSWYLFLFFTIITIVCLLILIIYKVKKQNIELFPEKITDFVKKYWFLFIICVILLFIYLAYSEWIWLNNCLDDGFYLNKIATLPYVDNPFVRTPATGLIEVSKNFNAYIVNTGELEMSVYVFLTRVTPTVFIRVFLSGFNYFLFVCCIYSLAEKIIKSTNISYSKDTMQYIVSIILLFSFSWNYLAVKNILIVQDSWQFVTAMYYASSVVRTMGIIIIIVHFLENEFISIKDVLFVILISIVLISKSTIALPVIFVTCMSYLMTNFLFDKIVWKKAIPIIILIVLGACGLLIGGNDHIENLVKGIFLQNAHSYFVIGCFISIALSFTLKSKIINKINVIMIIIFMLMEMPVVNNLFEKLSVYDFVAARANTTYMYTLVILAAIYLFIFINKVKFTKKAVVSIYLAGTVILTGLSLYSCNSCHGRVLSSYKKIYLNKKIIPDSTIMLGEQLTRLSNSVDEEINMIMPEGVVASGHVHSVAIIIRTFAPKINSISAIGRFGVGDETDFSSFSAEEQSKLDAFIANPTPENQDNFKNMLDKYPINCIVLPTAEDNEYLYDIGFTSFTKFSDFEGNIAYNIYYRALH